MTYLNTFLGPICIYGSKKEIQCNKTSESAFKHDIYNNKMVIMQSLDNISDKIVKNYFSTKY